MKHPVALIFPGSEVYSPDKDSTKKYLKEMNQNLPKHEQIRVFEIMDNPLPVDAWTPTEKIKRHFVEEEYKNVIEGIYPFDL
jgi:long-subunit acyl-CoA synthetase (AMP-forming)